MGPVKAIGVCRCGSQTFNLKIYDYGNNRAHCTECGEAWETGWQAALWAAADRGSGQDADGDATVGEARDEPADLGAAAPGGGGTPQEKLTEAELYASGLTPGQFAYVRSMTTRARQEQYLAKKRENEALMGRRFTRTRIGGVV